MLAGYKTYGVAGVMAALAFARAMDWLDESTYQTLLGLLGATGLATLRAGVTKSGPRG
jgi:hypothetical protein